MTNQNDFSNRRLRRKQLFAEAAIQNKATLFAELTTAGITAVTAHFEGERGAGGINDIVASAGERPVLRLPAGPDTLQSVMVGDQELMTVPAIDLETLLVDLCSDFLFFDYPGWQRDDGGFGVFTFDVPRRTITVELSTRVKTVVKSTRTY